MIKPMLSGKADLAKLKYPVMVSPKLDGIRAIVVRDEDGSVSVRSRSMKKIPNRHIQAMLSHEDFVGLDGELVVGPITAPDVYRVTDSGVMTIKGQPDFVYCIFDRYDMEHSFDVRLRYIRDTWLPLMSLGYSCVKLVPHVWVENEEDLLQFEEECLNNGFEGIMIRDPFGKYKFGRSTTNEGILLKLKRYAESEARIIGFEEEMENQNVAYINEVGHTARSTSKENLRPKGRLGNLIVQDLSTGVVFSLGSGFTDQDKETIWNDQSGWMGRLITYKHFLIGVKDKPRFPVYKGLRNDL